MKCPGLSGGGRTFAASEREEERPLSEKGVFWSVLVVNVVAIALAILLGNPPAEHFDDGRVMTFFSVAQLLAVFGLTRRTFLLRSSRESEGDFKLRDWRAPHFVWAVIAAGFLYLALDDLLLIHENLDGIVHWAFGIKETALSDRLDDLIVVCYGQIGLAVLILYRGEILRFRRLWPYLAPGLALFALTAVLDVVTNREDILVERFRLSEDILHWAEAAEESFKTLGVGVFVGLAYRCRELAKRM